MIQKEVLMYFIAFNAIKLMINDNKRQETQSDEMSFNACRQILNALAANADNCMNKSESSKAVGNILSGCKILKRFGRIEPRALKRRLKPFKLLTKPRAELKAELLGAGSGKMALT